MLWLKVIMVEVFLSHNILFHAMQLVCFLNILDLFFLFLRNVWPFFLYASKVRKNLASIVAWLSQKGRWSFPDITNIFAFHVYKDSIIVNQCVKCKSRTDPHTLLTIAWNKIMVLSILLGCQIMLSQHNFCFKKGALHFKQVQWYILLLQKLGGGAVDEL